ncbi:MAG: peptide chain release factor N(5)-glutamine methyltransferase [Alphaproteobacteria bacterium]|nr:peptide chain release factor N(5)-glutamine methyltransferase [Alphaproteobacteria bacterium]
MDSSDLVGFTDTPELDFKWLKEASNGDEKILTSFILRRKKGEPVAKIIGQKGFWTLDLAVSTATLDPRPDSETLIDAVLKQVPDKDTPLRILDLGTGSGCLLLALLSEYKKATGIGIDISQEALKIAQKNVDKYASDRAQLIHNSWKNEKWWDGLGKFDIVISNPPYIPTADIPFLDKDVKDYDPIEALDGGIDGLDDYRSLSYSIENVLKKEALVFFEIGKGQETDVIKIMKEKGFTLHASYYDFGQILRVLAFIKNH